MCGKLLCTGCKNIFRRRHQVGAGDSRSVYVTQHELCTPCLCDSKIKQINSPGKYCFILFAAIFFIIGIGVFSGMSSVFSAMPFNMPPVIFILPVVFILVALFLIYIGIRNVATAPKRTEIMKAKKEEFLNSLSSEASAPETSRYKYCPHCGDKVDIDAKICDKCGGDLLS